MYTFIGVGSMGLLCRVLSDRTSLISCLLLLSFLPALLRAETPTWSELENRQQAISQRESDLLQQYRSLPKRSADPAQLTKYLSEMTGLLTTEELEKLHSSTNLTREKGELPAPIQAALKEINAFQEKVGPFQESYDQYNVERIGFISDLYRRVAEDLVIEAKSQGASRGRQLELAKLLKETRAHHRKFQEKLALNDADRDKDWMGPFFEQHKSMLRLASASGNGNRTWSEKIGGTGRKLSTVWHVLKVAMAGISQFPRGIRRMITREASMPQTQKFVDKLTSAAGWTLQVGERPAPLPTPNTIDIGILNHTTSSFMGALDGLSLGRLVETDPVFVNGGLQEMDFSGILGERLGKWAKEQLAAIERENPNNIVVGIKEDPVSQFMERYEAGKTKALFVLAEGNTFEGNIYGVRPIQAAFSLGVVENLRRRKKLNVRVLPISSPLHYRFWNSSKGHPTDPKDLVTVVHDPIPPAVVDLLMASGHKNLLSQVVRQYWIHSLDEYSPAERPLGTPPIDDLVEMNQEAIGKVVNCKLVWQGLGSGS